MMEHKLICESRVFIYLNPLSPHYGDQVVTFLFIWTKYSMVTLYLLTCAITCKGIFYIP